jgi:hypothetical protein
MFSFFKRKDKYPAFRLLWSFEKKDWYFSRNAEWGCLDDKHIFVTLPRNLKTIQLQEWAQLVYLSATGTVTVIEFVRHIADQYNGDIPDNLDHIIIHELLDLANAQLITFSKQKHAVPPEFEHPGFVG